MARSLSPLETTSRSARTRFSTTTAREWPFPRGSLRLERSSLDEPFCESFRNAGCDYQVRRRPRRNSNKWPVRRGSESGGKLRQRGALQGGSAIGAGVCARKTGAAPAINAHLAGLIRVTAESLAAAKSFLTGNPVYESGGTVEIREFGVDPFSLRALQSFFVCVTAPSPLLPHLESGSSR